MPTWDIRRDGHAWGVEAMSRYQMTPEKTEMLDGRLYGTEEDRLTMLALLLENVGADKAVRLGEASVWRAAVAALDEGIGTRKPKRWPISPPRSQKTLLKRRSWLACRRSMRRSRRSWTDHLIIGASRILFTVFIIKASKYSGFNSRPTPSFGGSVASSPTVRCIHGFSRSFVKERARSSRHLITIAGRL